VSQYPVIVNFVIALSAEAQAIIRFYKLKRNHEVSAFEIYQNKNINLIITGMGKLNSAVASGYLAGSNPPGGVKIWLNVGIAGGGKAEIGEIFLANRIVDAETEKRNYPSICFHTKLPQAGIITLNGPGQNYDANNLFDMEAAGFYTAASRFSSTELVHCLKIVSDNHEQGVSEVNYQTTDRLIEKNMHEIDLVVALLLRLAEKIVPQEKVQSVMGSLTARYRFSVTQQNLLIKLLQSWFALECNSDFPVAEFSNFRDSSSCLTELENRIRYMPVSYTPK